jgi:hypothetical protein
MRIRAILLMAALPVFGQEIKMPASVERLASKAVESVDVMLDGALLQLAGRFLSGHKPDEARVKNMLGGLKGIYVRSFEFSQEGEYSAEDVEAIRSQLRVPGWSKILGVVSKKDKEHTEIYIKAEGSRVGGLVILAAEPKELTLVHINGSIDLDKLSELGGHFGIPKIDVEKKPAKD